MFDFLPNIELNITNAHTGVEATTPEDTNSFHTADE